MIDDVTGSLTSSVSDVTSVMTSCETTWSVVNISSLTSRTTGVGHGEERAGRRWVPYSHLSLCRNATRTARCRLHSTPIDAQTCLGNSDGQFAVWIHSILFDAPVKIHKLDGTSDLMSQLF